MAALPGAETLFGFADKRLRAAAAVAAAAAAPAPSAAAAASPTPAPPTPKSHELESSWARCSGRCSWRAASVPASRGGGARRRPQYKEYIEKRKNELKQKARLKRRWRRTKPRTCGVCRRGEKPPERARVGEDQVRGRFGRAAEGAAGYGHKARSAAAGDEAPRGGAPLIRRGKMCPGR